MFTDKWEKSNIYSEKNVCVIANTVLRYLRFSVKNWLEITKTHETINSN